MNGEILAWATVTYLGLVAFAVLFFKAGARYDEQSEQLYELSNGRQRTDDRLPIQN
jgi:hypothetical protein